jgi:putative tricarboxylic transport membrane protein
MIAARRDRVGGVIVALIGIAVAVEARTFTVGFLTDPLGPKVLPYLVAALLVAGGMSLIVKPDRDGDWPDAPTWRRAGAAVLAFVLYAALLPLFGFLGSTWACLVALGWLFGGPWKWNAVLAAIFTVTLYLVFSVLLGLTLPIGTLFIVRPG